MNWFKTSLTQQLVVLIGGTLTILMVVVSAFDIASTKGSLSKSIDSQVNQLFEKNVIQIEGFF